MEEVLSSRELTEKLTLLRNILHNFDYSKLYNVIFFNLYSVYQYMSQIAWEKDKKTTISGLLDEVERYIPLGLTNTSLDLFLTAATSPEEWETEELNRIFSCRCRMDFINLVRMAKDVASWEKILDACEDMRKEMETHYYFI